MGADQPGDGVAPIIQGAAAETLDELFRSIADHAPAMLWVTASDGRCSYLNPAWYRFTGQDENLALGFGWLEAIHPDDRARSEAIFRRANIERRSFELEYRLRTASGSYRWAIDAGNPRFHGNGEFAGFVGSVVDIHDRRETEYRLLTLTNAAPAFVWFADREGEVHYLNDRWYEYTGQTPEQTLPDGWIAAVHAEDVERVAAAWADARRLQVSYEIECRYRRRDGAYRWYIARAEPAVTEDGELIAWMGASSDIHEHKLAEQRQALLINELNHRVKNTLSTVQGLAAQTAYAAGDPQTFREAFESRLLSLSSAHDLLTSSNWEGADLAAVVQRALSPWSAGQVETSGPGVWLGPQQALSMSMALHELATNAAKYGALSGRGGRVSVAWRRTGAGADERIRLCWRESGGPLVAPPARRGFGSRLLERALGRELGGTVTLSFRAEGVECVIDFPTGCGEATPIVFG